MVKISNNAFLGIFIFVLIVTGNASCKSQEIATNKSIPVADTLRAKIIFAGDVMGHMPQVNAARIDSTDGYDFTPVYEYVKNYITNADYAIANLEVPLAGKPYSGYPQFSSPDEQAVALKTVGFDALILANNHVLDRGKKGALRTISVLDSLKLKRAGVYKDTIERRKHYPLYLDINKIKIAVLNYTYGTNGYKPEKPLIVNYIDTLTIKRDIENCKKSKSDFIIATFHWGAEYERFTIREQRVVADFMARNGVNAIVGSHPHVVEPFQLLYPNPKDSNLFVPIIYSVGNFTSNQRDRYRDGGIIFELNIEKITNTGIVSAGYLPVWVYKGWQTNKMVYKLIPPAKFDDAQNRFSFSKEDSAKCTDFYNDTRSHLANLSEISITD